jgi:hypothetical protein
MTVGNYKGTNIKTDIKQRSRALYLDRRTKVKIAKGALDWNP